MLNTFSGTLAVKALATTTITNSAANGNAVDLGQYGNNFRDVLFVVNSGTLTDGSYAVTVEESDSSGSGYAAVDSSRILGSLPAYASTDDGVWTSFGVRPTKRYVRIVVTPSGATSGGPFTATAILAHGSNNPVARS